MNTKTKLLSILVLSSVATISFAQTYNFSGASCTISCTTSGTGTIPVVSTGTTTTNTTTAGTIISGGSITPGVSLSNGCTLPSNTTLGTLAQTGTNYNQMETGTVGSGLVKSFPFVLEAAAYPYGAKFNIESGYSDGAYNVKDISISSCPGVFEGLSLPCRKVNLTAGAINTAPVGNGTSLCQVDSGKTFYFNIRPSVIGQNTSAMISPMPR